MRILRLFLSLVALLAGIPVLQAQVVTTQPALFRDTDPVTIVFDATQGNGALANFTGDVYIWTGVITDKSNSNSDWKYVKSPTFNQADPAAKMTRDATNPNRYTIALTPSVRSWYGVAAGDQVQKLAMIFKNAAGTTVGRATGGGDIFVDVAQTAFAVAFTSPASQNGNPIFVNSGASVSVRGEASTEATLTLTLNGTQVAQQTNTKVLTATVPVTQAGQNDLVLTATSGTNTASATRSVIVRAPFTTAALPTGAKKDGVTYINNGTSAILTLTAPFKKSVYVLGDFNNWQPGAAYQLKRTDTTATATRAADDRWWVQIDGLTPGQEYAYQFLVNETMRVADPFTEKVLDPDNDQYINAGGYTVYPNLKAYPAGKTNGIVSVLQSNAPAYTWQTTNFQRPARTDMVVYELLPRDFVARHDYKTLTDTLAYMKRLGVNVIELMPSNEFEGNESWGYNVSYYFAPDKYYGPKNDLKRFIDECHKRGIAVVLDVVLNQSFGQSPMVQMYFDGTKPAANNPWFNPDATHPFSVGYDFNHESPYTRYFSKRIIEHWLKEYNVDGYRFDLSKGFTQKVSTNTADWGQYDQSRVNIWKDYHDYMVSVDQTAYPILEHLGNNDEEKVLSDMGMMLWGIMTYNYNEATMGYLPNSNFSYGYYGSTAQGGRGWSQPNLVTYMESHDEERLMYKNLTFGNSSGSYSVKNLPTALARQEMAAAFFFPVPGPKMIWQFGELGYDKSIFSCPDGTVPQPYPTDNCKLGNKPILWNYYQDPNRRHLFDVYRSLIALKVQEPAFENPASFTQNLSGAVKTMQLTDPRLSVTVVGNFDVVPATATVTFPQTGTWYNYLTSEQLNVTSATMSMTLAPGQYAVYTSRKVAVPAGTVLATKRQRDASVLQLTAQPNPAAASAQLRYSLPQATTVHVTVTNLLGATVHTLPATRQAAGAHELELPLRNLASGVYLVQLTTGQQQQAIRLVVQK
ncbi:alpha-amylase family glycosyl hydrolase [Hymenobacter sp. 5516J-16]|uniref:alpha-amylase family glycosyl hydrolase n=1 Tax=Hymenobacter sp. 5516J-16 TaxID=2932253 RepID=UPI001FD508AF|nr:alpha-amylase family glycosyl hydrolase [Hymenobacter sp. 5516J-16]UOQ76767.1 alpha-amylase family glycosyl hydrolase [Hymenobacter sp. 5516J-16]